LAQEADTGLGGWVSSLVEEGGMKHEEWGPHIVKERWVGHDVLGPHIVEKGVKEGEHTPYT